MDDKNTNPSTNMQETKEEINKSVDTIKVEESKDINPQTSVNTNPVSKPVEQKQVKEESKPSQSKLNENLQSTSFSNKSVPTKLEKKEELKPVTSINKSKSSQSKILKNNSQKIHLGDRVRINPRCTKTVTGVTIPSFAYSNIYTVKKIYPNRILIKINTLQYAVTINDVIKLK